MPAPRLADGRWARAARPWAVPRKGLGLLGGHGLAGGRRSREDTGGWCAGRRGVGTWSALASVWPAKGCARSKLQEGPPGCRVPRRVAIRTAAADAANTDWRAAIVCEVKPWRWRFGLVVVPKGTAVQIPNTDC